MSSGRDDAEAPEPSAHALQGEGIHKSYGGVHALRGASLAVGRGEVHGLVGQNGSGKSTLLGILSGQQRPDRGRVLVAGRPVDFSSPVDALAAGVVVVTQETTLVPDLSVAENVLLGRRLVRGRRGIDWPASHRAAEEVLQRLRLDIDPARAVRSLPLDQQQMVEIARAISMRAQVVILDEPTSALTEDQVDALFDVIRALRDEEVSTVFVSHRLSEILTVTDHVTVLRDGESVASAPTTQFDHASLIVAMVGHAVGGPHVAEHASGRTTYALHARDVRTANGLGPISLEVAPGETVGLAGLVGSGRSELLRALAGYEPLTGGEVTFEGRAVSRLAPAAAMRRGIAFVPSDRKVDGLVLSLSVAENLLMVRTAGRSRLGPPGGDRRAGALQPILDEYQIKAPSLDAPVSTLSGGNQQKVMLAKWLACGPRLVLLEDPTRGVDVGAKAEIYRLIEAAKQDGCAVIVSSSENDELRELCDRIVVMARGRAVAELDRDHATDAQIAHHAMGAATLAA